MDNAKIVDLMDREVDISALPQELKLGLRKFYYEMPTGVRMDIAMHLTEVFPDITPNMFVHMTSKDIDGILQQSSELVKIFDAEIKRCGVRHKFTADWFIALRNTIFVGSWDSDSLMYGLRAISTLYHRVLDSMRKDPDALQFMANYLRAWLRQKELGMNFFCKVYSTPEYFRLVSNPVTLCDIVDEYLRTDVTNTAGKIGLEKLFYANLQVEPSGSEEDNIFIVLDVMRANEVKITFEKCGSQVVNYSTVSVMTESTVSDNIGQVSIFGTHNFGAIPISQIKSELLSLDRNTISDYLNEKPNDSGIRFDISDQVKMILREEISTNMCAVAINRGNEVDMATLLTLDSKVYLLFRKDDDADTTFGISLGTMNGADRELISISNESDFTYKLVGGEEIGIEE